MSSNQENNQQVVDGEISNVQIENKNYPSYQLTDTVIRQWIYKKSLNLTKSGNLQEIDDQKIIKDMKRSQFQMIKEFRPVEAEYKSLSLSDTSSQNNHQSLDFKAIPLNSTSISNSEDSLSNKSEYLKEGGTEEIKEIKDQKQEKQEKTIDTIDPDANILPVKKRLDRYGVEIIPRNVTLKSGKKSEHKLVFVDKVNKQQEPDAILNPDKKKLIYLERDADRKLENIHYVLSMKQYNADLMASDDAHSNQMCNCNIF